MFEMKQSIESIISRRCRRCRRRRRCCRERGEEVSMAEHTAVGRHQIVNKMRGKTKQQL